MSSHRHKPAVTTWSIATKKHLLWGLHRFLRGIDNYQAGVDRDCDWTLMMCEMILLRSLFLYFGSCVQSVVLWLLGKYLPASELYRPNADIIIRIFFYGIFQWMILQFESCVAVCLRSSWPWRFLEQGRVATPLTCGGVFNNNLMLIYCESASERILKTG